MRTPIFLTVLLIPLLQACVQTEPKDVTLSASAAEFFQQYKTVPGEKAAAITTDGKHLSYSYCKNLDCRGSARSVAVQSCQESRDSVRFSRAQCQLFAVGDRIVWNGAVSIPDPESPMLINFNQAEGTTPRGPATAEGVIVYIPGNHYAIDLSPNDGVVPFYLKSLAEDGWDVIKAVSSNAEMIGEVHDRGAATINAKLRDLRRAGYQNVVLAGQSFGAWMAIRSSNEPDSPADAIIAAVPATYGPERLLDGDTNPHFEKNQTDLLPLLEEANSRLMVIFFEEDPFDPPGRSDAAIKALNNDGLHQVIDKPAGLTGHGAAWLAAFDFSYGQCIREFIESAESADSSDCQPPARDATDHRWMTHKDDFVGSPARQMTTEEMTNLVGNTVVGYLETGDIAAYYLSSNRRTLGRIESGYRRSDGFSLASSAENDQFCFISQNECYEIYRWDEDLIIAVTPNGDIAFRGQILPGNPRGFYQDTTGVYVSSIN